ncbi:MBL fold metallo-hydrolase [Pseudalkalibacillus sp. SCS-8]|uniref:MBL fold metallo-hydrolase n=1 Tax=Pseudalkalibacillus nanhaiensis TaxID=3115291 RepID=UPI0032DBCCB5
MNHLETIHCITLPTPFAVGDVNLYLIEGEKLTLVDTGPKTPEAWQSFQSQLNALGFKPGDIDQVILTHHHPDHVGLADYLKEDKIPFICLEYNLPWLKKDPDFFAHHDQFYFTVYKEMGIEKFHKKAMERVRGYLDYSCTIEVDQIVKEGDGIAGLPGWYIIETPGHAQGHLSLIREEDGLMIGGDHLIKHISSNALIEPPPTGNTARPKTLLQYRESLRKLIEHDVKKVLAGHGEPVEHPVELVQLRLLKQEERADDILKIISKESMTGFEICQKLFPTIFLKELGLTMSETLGHLDLLMSKDQVTIHQVDGVLYFRAKEVITNECK